uniref:Ras-GAP domain-containing protein n=1 Tax=Panagrolaimus sp. JU765 TaxID=591449 RepID=A0AC34R635_9BILA
MPIEKVGDLRIKFWYSVEHILSLNHYQPLHDALLSALHAKPYDASLASLLQHLPIELGSIARPLMKIFLQNGLFEEFFRLVCVQYLSDGRESATLFRNQSMASKLMHEVMKYLGNDYLVSTLKPVIDLVYAEKKRTEIDPSKLNPGEKLDENTRNLAVYAELAIVRVVESADECPKALKNIFAVLRNAVNEFYPKVEIGRLAVSSFIIMRFFSAAILNPTQYGLKKRAPDPEVSRTL